MSSNIFTKRGISADVKDTYGFAEYAPDDARAIIGGKGGDRRWLAPDLHPNDPHFLDRIIAVPGWLMPRPTLMPWHPTFGSRPYAQLRPDVPVMASLALGHHHYGMRHVPREEAVCACGEEHASPPVKRSEWPLPVGREPAVTYHWYQTPLRDRLEHEASVCDPAPAGTPEAELLRYGVWKNGELVRDKEGRVLVRTGHLHPDTGEVIVPVEGVHRHLDWAKYVYPPGYGRAARISTHPAVRGEKRGQKYATPDHVMFLALEGVLKCCAIVSAGWPAVEAGSVTLWDSVAHHRGLNELQAFAQTYLQGVKVAVVCDSDWVLNKAVRDQVRYVVRALAEVNVDAMGCAPKQGEWLGWNDPVTGLPRHAKLGVDDHLGLLNFHDRHDALLQIPMVDLAHLVATDDLIAAMDVPDPVTGRRPRGLENVRAYIEAAQEIGGPGGVFVEDSELYATAGQKKAGHQEAEAIPQRTMYDVRRHPKLPPGTFTELRPAFQYQVGNKRRTHGAYVQLHEDHRPKLPDRPVGDWLFS